MDPTTGSPARPQKCRNVRIKMGIKKGVETCAPDCGH